MIPGVELQGGVGVATALQQKALTPNLMSIIIDKDLEIIKIIIKKEKMV